VTAKTADVGHDCGDHGFLIRGQRWAGHCAGPIVRNRLASNPALLEQARQGLPPLASNRSQRVVTAGTCGEGRQHFVLNRCPAGWLLQALAAGAGQPVLQRGGRQMGSRAA
jgi:hypothetical protein